MTPEDVRICAGAGVDAVGFVTEYPVAVPWNISRETARELVAATPPFITTTAVVGGSVASILEIAETVRPNVLQLHGDESVADIQRICRTLSPRGVKVVKALRIDAETGRANFSEADPLEAARLLARTGISGLAVDSKTAGRPAGTGVPLNWGVVARIPPLISVPLILAGGLTIQNVGAAIEQVRPYGVDIISGVESAPGVKDAALVAEFVRAVRRCERTDR